MSGWFAIKHGIRKHPIFRKRPDRLGAWVAMLDEAAFAETVQDVSGEIVKVRRGELCASQAMLEEITGMSRQKLRTFLAALEASGAIKTRPATKSTKSRTIVTFCNYDKYQSQQPSINQASTKHQPTKEQDKQTPPTEGASADPVKVMFDAGIELLTSAGIPAQRARPILGKWRKQHGAEAVISAIGQAKREGAIEPVSFIEGCFKFRNKRSSVPEVGAVKTFPNGQTKQYHGVGVGWIQVHA